MIFKQCKTAKKIPKVHDKALKRHKINSKRDFKCRIGYKSISDKMTVCKPKLEEMVLYKRALSCWSRSELSAEHTDVEFTFKK